MKQLKYLFKSKFFRILSYLISLRFFYSSFKVLSSFPRELNLDGKKVLIFAPHPDDETFGCFSIIENAKLVDVVLITRGGKVDKSVSLDNSQIKQLRLTEFRKVSEYKNFNIVGDFNLEDSEIDVHELRSKILNIKWNYDYIFAPNINDNHPDHHIVTACLLDIKTKLPNSLKIFFYEVWTTFNQYDHFVEIRDLNNKLATMSLYESQTISFNYLEGICGLNKYRGLQCNRHAVEAFKLYEE